MRLKKVARMLALMLVLVLGTPGVLAQDDLPTYDTYTVLDVQDLPLIAGVSRQSSAHLSPDGTRFVHVDGSTFCFYMLDDNNVWVEEACTELDREISGRDTEEIYWSPDGQWLTLPTYRDAFVFLYDTDIRILNTETFEAVVLTQDQTTGTPIDLDYSGFFDIAPQWLDDDTLLFLRYIPDDDLGYAHLMHIDLSGSEPQEVTALTAPSRVSIYLIAASRASSEVAYNINDFGSAPENGIWTMGLDNLEPEQAVAIEEGPDLPQNLAYSANGSYLLNINARGTVYGTTVSSVVEVVDPATGEIIPLDDSQIVIGAGWSPEGSALAYLVNNPENPESSGLYISPAPGEPGHLVLAGQFAPPTSSQRMPLVWANNDTILIGNRAEGILLIRVGVK